MTGTASGERPGKGGSDLKVLEGVATKGQTGAETLGWEWLESRSGGSAQAGFLKAHLQV